MIRASQYLWANLYLFIQDIFSHVFDLAEANFCKKLNAKPNVIHLKLFTAFTGDEKNK